jgi:hypothetical protein
LAARSSPPRSRETSRGTKRGERCAACAPVLLFELRATRGAASGAAAAARALGSGGVVALGSRRIGGALGAARQKAPPWCAPHCPARWRRSTSAVWRKLPCAAQQRRSARASVLAASLRASARAAHERAATRSSRVQARGPRLFAAARSLRAQPRAARRGVSRRARKAYRRLWATVCAARAVRGRAGRDAR